MNRKSFFFINSVEFDLKNLSHSFLKVRLMERRLTTDSDWEPSSSPPTQNSLITRSLPNTDEATAAAASASTSAPASKDKLIEHLESEVEQQRQLRLADAKQVEAKAARIKDWVTNKLRELEDQNTHLKAQNEHCNEQMELLRKKLEQLQVMSGDKSSSSSAAEKRRSKSRTSVVSDWLRFYSIVTFLDP